MSEVAVQFNCDDAELIGVLHQPTHVAARAPKSVGLLVIVGGPQYRVGSHRQFVMLARHASAAGYPVFRFDYRGMGDSDGDLRSFDSIEADIQAAIGVFAANCPDLTSICIFGLCDAASAALMFCTSDPRVGGLVLANPWVHTDAARAKVLVKHYYRQRLLQKAFWLKFLSARLNPLRSLAAALSALKGARSGTPETGGFIARMLNGLQRFHGRSVLLLLSERDLTAREFESLVEADELWRRAVTAPGVSRIRLHGADHTFSDERSMESANAAILGFLDDLQGGAATAAKTSQGLLR